MMKWEFVMQMRRRLCGFVLCELQLLPSSQTEPLSPSHSPVGSPPSSSASASSVLPQMLYLSASLTAIGSGNCCLIVAHPAPLISRKPCRIVWNISLSCCDGVVHRTTALQKKMNPLTAAEDDGEWSVADLD